MYFCCFAGIFRKCLKEKNSTNQKLNNVDENVWILISWLMVKPADLVLHGFRKREQNIEAPLSKHLY